MTKIYKLKNMDNFEDYYLFYVFNSENIQRKGRGTDFLLGSNFQDELPSTFEEVLLTWNLYDLQGEFKDVQEYIELYPEEFI